MKKKILVNAVIWSTTNGVLQEEEELSKFLRASHRGNTDNAQQLLDERDKLQDKYLEHMVLLKNSMETCAADPGPFETVLLQFSENYDTQLSPLDQIEEEFKNGKKVEKKVAPASLVESSVEFQDPNDIQLLFEEPEKKRKRYVHIFPHSHTDLGWLATADDYFTGKNTSWYRGSVQDILNSVMIELQKDSKKTFTYAEMKYFKQWFEKLQQRQKDAVKKLIQSGQLVIVNGGWSAPDEATTTYDDLVNNFMIGHQFLANEFGEEHVPNIGWQIDAFGVSTGWARLAKDFGFDAMFFSRNDVQEKRAQRKNKDRIQTWRPHERNFDNKKELLSISMDSLFEDRGNYCWPKGFWVDQNFVHDDQIESFIEGKPQYDLPERVRKLGLLVEKQFSFEKPNVEHTYLTFGCDYAFVQASGNYMVMDLMMKEWQKQFPDIEMLYSTPKKYVEEIKKTNETWSVRKDDTFPYSQSINSFWSGFYSSRPVLKEKARSLSHLLQATLPSLSEYMLQNPDQYSDIQDQLQKVLDTQGLIQHHDAITGTSVLRVTEDYLMKMEESIQALHNINQNILQQKLNLTTELKHNLTLANNSSFIMITTQKQGLIEMENIPYQKFSITQLVQNKSLSVPFDQYRAKVMANADQTFVSNKAFFRPAEGRSDFGIYKIENLENGLKNIEENFLKAGNGQVITDKNGRTLKYEGVVSDQSSPNKGAPIFEYFDNSNTRQRFALNLRYYQSSAAGLNKDEKEEDRKKSHKDGIYEFAADPQTSLQYSQFSPNLIKYKQGNFSGQFLLVFLASNQGDLERGTVLMEFDQETNHVKFDLQLNEVPIRYTETGKNVVVEWNLLDSFDTNNVLYVDANGLEMQEKFLYKRKEFNFTTENIAASNFYPMTSAIAVRDFSGGQEIQKQVTILSDKSHAASAGMRQQSNIEIMVQRRQKTHDDDGLGDLTLDEKDSQGRGVMTAAKFYMIIQNVNKTGGLSYQRSLQKSLEQPPLKYFALGQNVTLNSTTTKHVSTSSLAQMYSNTYLKVLPLPILKSPNKILVRLTNLFDKFDSDQGGQEYFNLLSYARQLQSKPQQSLTQKSAAKKPDWSKVFEEKKEKETTLFIQQPFVADLPELEITKSASKTSSEANESKNTTETFIQIPYLPFYQKKDVNFVFTEQFGSIVNADLDDENLLQLDEDSESSEGTGIRISEKMLAGVKAQKGNSGDIVREAENKDVVEYRVVLQPQEIRVFELEYIL